MNRILKRLAKALIRMRVCTGWSEPLLVLLESGLYYCFYIIREIILTLFYIPFINNIKSIADILEFAVL